MKHLAIIALLISLTACTANNSNLPSPTTNPTAPSQSNTPAPTTLNTSHWETHSLPAVGLSFKLPPKLDFLGETQQQIVAGETGTQLCVQFVKSTAWYERLIPEAQAGGGCGTTPNSYIAMGTTSIDYSAGREGSPLDLQGFVKKDNKYLFRFVNKTNEIFEQKDVKQLNNPNGVEIVIVKGHEIADDGPTMSNFIGDRTAAIINTKEKTYPGFVMLFEKTITQEEITAILESVKFSN